MRKAKIRSLALLTLSLLAVRAEAFIPPVSRLIADAVENKKAAKAIELVMRHRVQTNQGQPVEVEERLLWDRGRVQLFFKVPGVAQFIAVGVDSRGYSLDYGKTWSRRSRVFYNAFFADSADELLEPLLSDEFIRRDQLVQYKPGFQPTGDPKDWELKEGYLRHDDIYLHRLGRTVAIAVAGATDAQHRRVVYFDRDRKSVRRFEWTDGADTVAWNYESFLKSPPIGQTARHLTFEVNGSERIQTDVLQVLSPSDRQVSDLKRLPHLSRGATPPAQVEEVLGLLLSYR